MPALQSSSRPLCGGQVPLHTFEKLLQLRRSLVGLGCSCRRRLLLLEEAQCKLVDMEYSCESALQLECVLGGEPGTAAAATACCSCRQGVRLGGHFTCNAKV